MKKTIKSRLQRAAGILALAGTLAVTGGTVAQVATAKTESPAHAITYSSPWKQQTGGYWCPVFMKVTSVNFWDWLAGKRVGQVEFQYYARC